MALLAALALGARTGPALLRRLSRLLADAGPDHDPDVGTEHCAWNQPDLVADERARALRPDRHEDAEAAFCAIPAQTRHEILAARAAFHRQRSPFVRLGEALDDAKHWAANLLRRIARRAASPWPPLS